MSRKKLKERKLKKKAEEKKASLLRRRKAVAKNEKEAHKAKLIMKMLEEDKHGKQQPFIKDPEARALNRRIKRQKTIEKIEANLAVLEEIQNQFYAEQEARKQLNENLEDEGYKTLEEKMKGIGEQAKEMQKMVNDLKEAQKASDEENKEI